MQNNSKNNDSGRDLKRRIRAGDSVKVMTGADRGKMGAVLRCEGSKVVVQGVNMRKKHVKPSEGAPKGGTVEFEKPIHISNVRVCTPEGKPVKLRVSENAETKELYYLDGEKRVAHRVINQKQR